MIFFFYDYAIFTPRAGLVERKKTEKTNNNNNDDANFPQKNLCGEFLPAEKDWEQFLVKVQRRLSGWLIRVLDVQLVWARRRFVLCC